MKKRIFAAVDISVEARRRVAGYISELKKDFSDLRLGWERPEKLHLTLKFFGDTDAAQLEKLKEAAESLAGRFSNMRFRISKTGVFPSARNARVLWLGVEGDVEKLREMNAFLENEGEKFGFRKENRTYRPHLTIARIREPHRAKPLVEAHLAREFEPAEFEASELVIYESRLQPTGSVYKKVSGFGFRK
jgi:2'-5' RNA ligase